MKPTPEQLRKRIDYCAESGSLHWRAYDSPADWQFSWNKRLAGKPAFNHQSKRGYLNGSWKPYTLTAHRVAWAIYYGHWPRGQIDHINGNRTDNRISNLRCVDNATNAKNMRRKVTNKSGRTGVFWASHVGKWTAQITVSGKAKYLGLFVEKSDAISAREQAERAYGFHRNHGADHIVTAPTQDKLLGEGE